MDKHSGMAGAAVIYVDDPMTHVKGKFRDYCHMWTDGTHEELDAFAQSIGLKKAWAQNKRGSIVKDFYHYDISPSYRHKALVRGAEYMPLSQWIKRHMKPQTMRLL
jgi:hypothetical protein